MEILIRLFLKIFKIIIGTIIIFALFIFWNAISMITLSYLSIENFNKNESPNPMFMLVFEAYDVSLDRQRFDCVRWDDFEEMDCYVPNVDSSVGKFTCVNSESYGPREYSTYLSVAKGHCDNMSSTFVVETLGPDEQVVKVRWSLEAFTVDNHYSLVDNEIKPLYFRKLLGSDIAVFGFLISLILTPISIVLVSFLKRKYKKIKPTNKIEAFTTTLREDVPERGGS